MLSWSMSDPAERARKNNKCAMIESRVRLFVSLGKDNMDS